MSADVDVTVRLRTANLRPFLVAMKANGFTPRVADVEGFAKETRVLPFIHEPSRIPVDVVLAGPGPEEEFLARARTVEIEGVEVPVISPEDLVVTKVLAGRPKDLEDIRGVLRQASPTFDFGRVRSLLAALEDALGRSDLLPLFDAQRSASESKKR